MPVRDILPALEVRGRSTTDCRDGRRARWTDQRRPSRAGRDCHRMPEDRWANANTQMQQERHSYEKCQYVEFKKRVAKMDELRAAKGGARSN